MLNALFALLILAAVGTVAWRRGKRARLRAAAARQPGASADNAIWVQSFDEIDAHLARRWCSGCGGYLQKTGEGPREHDGRRLRAVRFVCQECEESESVYFDTTDILH